MSIPLSRKNLFSQEFLWQNNFNMKTDLKTFFKRLYQKALYEEDILSTAAQVAFYFSFAIFPLLLFLVSLFGLILDSAEEFRSELFFYLRQIMPYTAFDLVQKTIQEVTENSSGGKLTIGLLIALWSASAGIDSLRTALNSVYNLKETRSWFKTKALALVLTFSLTVLITIACGIVFYGWKFLSFILDTVSIPIPSPFFLMILQWLTVLIVLLIIFGILYNFLPMHKPHSWVWITPGSITGIILWLSVSYAFRLYLSYFNNYNRTYGSLGAMIILLLWLYLTALVILIGGIINATLQEMTDPETAAESEKMSEIKLEKAKADRAEESIEEVKAETKKIQNESGKKATGKIQPLPVLNKNETDSAIDENTESKQVHTEENSTGENKKTANSSLIGMTVAGAFGFLMGLFMKKKRE